MSPEDMKVLEKEPAETRIDMKQNQEAQTAPIQEEKSAAPQNGRPSTKLGVIPRRFSKPGVNPLDEVKYDRRKTVITNPDGGVVFKMEDVEVPHTWSQLATDIVVSKYFRKAGVPGNGHEVSVRQVVYRVAHTIRNAGESLGGYFASSDEADVFEAELTHLLVNQKAAFNSPVWFNCGLYHEYGISGSGGNWRWDRAEKKLVETPDSYSSPQCSACFIQKVEDDLMSLFDLMKNEARLFKYGSGTGTNFSRIRGHQEKLSGGGTSSGLMSFLEVLDRGAGATKSGGTTRRAAKMVCLDMDHPEIVDFINWKVREERKVQALIQAGFDSDFNGEAYRTVSGQNSNNSVRLSDEFMEAVESDGKWKTYFRTTGEVCDTHSARELMDYICEAAWSCADPGVQFDTTINKWHTCKNTDKIYASNPCSEFMFLDDSACNLASINLMKFLREDDTFDIEGYRHAARTIILAQEILVGFSSYPTRDIARNSNDYRPLGLGYANLGAMLMAQGIAYDSKKARSIASALTAVMCGQAYAMSAEIASKVGPFAGYEKNADCMLEVMEMHRDEAYKIDDASCPPDMLAAAKQAWDEALELGSKHGYRNSQTTVLAPTGTIGLLMDCDTTGIEPDFALVKFKKLAGGGYFKIVNQSIPRALKKLGYTERQIQDIITYVSGSQTLHSAPHINHAALIEKGFTPEDLNKIESRLSSVFELSQAFAVAGLGDETLGSLQFKEEDYKKPGFNVLQALGFTPEQIEEANRVVCGMMTLEGAPHLKVQHQPIFDCANKCGSGERFIAPMAHLEMMSAAQKFISGAISKTVNIPNETTVEEINEIYLKSWKLGLKAIALYRDGCKMSQPLSSSSSNGKQKAVESDSDLSSDFQLELQEPVRVPTRMRLPKRRRGVTHEAKIANHKIYLRTGEYDDGSLGEIFIDMHKEGAAYRSILNCFAIAVSLGLQYGVPLKEFVNVFTFTRFEPQGPVDHPNIKMATSVIDYIFRLLAMEYLGRTDFVHVKPSMDEEKDADHALESANASLAPAPAPAMAVKPASARPGANGNGVAAGGENLEGMSKHLGSMMGDAPFCDQCGHVTVRNGSCYKCLNCGNSVGCS